MLKIGVLGAGHLGKIHINCIKQIEQYELVGFYDPADETARLVETEMDVKRFGSIDDLIDSVDVVDIVTPTIRHFECASKALQKRKHVFIEKPIVATPDEANALKKLADDKIVELDDERKAAMVSNLLVVLCADESASPVINTGTLYQ